jgi:hypothetical protein
LLLLITSVKIFLPLQTILFTSGKLIVNSQPAGIVFISILQSLLHQFGVKPRFSGPKSHSSYHQSSLCPILPSQHLVFLATVGTVGI